MTLPYGSYLGTYIFRYCTVNCMITYKYCELVEAGPFDKRLIELV